MLLERIPSPPELTMDEKIGEGKYREVYRSGKLAVKTLKDFRVKPEVFFSQRMPLPTYTRERFGIEDFNRHELENYQRLREAIPVNRQRLFCAVHWAGNWQGRSVSISDLAVNDDGTLAPAMAKFHTIEQNCFWSALNEMEELLLLGRTYFLDVNVENIVVCTQNGRPQPVLIDYKRLGRGTYPLQFWLRCEKTLAEKMKRKFQRIRELFNSRRNWA